MLFGLPGYRPDSALEVINRRYRRKGHESTDSTDSHRLNNASGGGTKIAPGMEHGPPRLRPENRLTHAGQKRDCFSFVLGVHSRNLCHLWNLWFQLLILKSSRLRVVENQVWLLFCNDASTRTLKEPT